MIGILTIAVGVFAIAAALMVASSSLMMSGVGFILGILIAAGLYVVSKFQSNLIQKWMGQSKLGRLSENEKFNSLFEQKIALEKLMDG
ncbi:hypothetical protein WI36_10690 [Burkholderia ubonensis]|nr:hypothetical protein WI36_10690 [Burkholderia ubonensis]